jgi:hypothetical protein
MARTWIRQGRKNIGILIKNVIFVDYPDGNILVETPKYKWDKKQS